MELIQKKKFIAIVFDLNNEIFVVYIVFFASSNLNVDIYLFCRSQIASLIVNETPTRILSEYTNFKYIFFLGFVAKLPKYTKINNYLIDLVKGQQLSYKPIYSLGPVKL